MATALQPTVVLDKIADRQQKIDAVRTVLLLAMAVPFILGWLAGKTVIVLWAVLSWVWAAAEVGWQTARSAPNTDGRT